MMQDRSTSRSTRVSSLRKQNNIDRARTYIYEAFPDLKSNPAVVGLAVDISFDRISPNSDVDIFIVSPEPQRQVCQPIGDDGMVADVQWVDMDEVQRDLQRKFLNLRSLRRLARLSRAHIVWERASTLSQIRALASDVVLAPSEAAVLLIKATAALRAANKEETLAGAVLKARGAAYALATLAIALTPRRFEKPKWLLDALRGSHSVTLETAILDLIGRPNLPMQAQACLVSTRMLILQMCELAGWPKLTRAEHAEDDYVHIYRNYRDAESLLQVELVPDAVLTADYALRLCDVLAAENLNQRIKHTSLEVWRRCRDLHIERQCAPQSLSIADIVTALEYSGRELQEEYKIQIRRIEELVE